MTINILGTEYTIMFKNDEEVCAAMNVQVGECGGYCSAAAKEIVIANLNTITDSEAEKDEYTAGSQYNETFYQCKCPECMSTANEVVMRRSNYD